MTRDLLVALLKMLCRGTLLKNPYLDIDKKLLKIKTNCILTDVLCFLGI